jgi:ADP-heptose:LPS heptosyltransferase
VSLQHGDTRAERERFAVEHGQRFAHWDEAAGNLDEMAALIAALDLVISVQTATVHLAGALGKPVWVAIPAVAEWRYLEHGDTLPWYPSARLFRQDRPGEWGPVLDRIGAVLGNVPGTPD